MSFLTSLVIVATLATIATLILGICSMVYHGESGRFDSEHWMAYRVFLQAIALLALVATFFVGT
jgi:Hypoxia induced protein conserved region